MGRLILLRHGRSLWNAVNKFTSWVDVPLSERGRAEATIVSCQLQEMGYRIDACFTSMLIRAIETAMVCLTECDHVRGGKVPVVASNDFELDELGWVQEVDSQFQILPIFPSVALDERYYGQLQGKNKTEMAQKYGRDQLQAWRRSFSARPPGGESLEDMTHRTIPFLCDRILPRVQQGETVLVVLHSNTLRAIVMQLDHLTPDEVPQIEFQTGVPIVYDIDPQGQILHKTILFPYDEDI